MQLRELTYMAVGVRILAALVLGGIIGLEREMKNRPAGLRAYMLVCVGSCLIMLTNQFLYQTTGTGDPARMSAQVISGIGFLGAGTIVVTQHNQIKGLTTAAGLWACAAVGLAIGIGFYEAALVSGVAVYVTLTLLQRWDKRMRMKGKFFDIYFALSKGYPLGNFIRAVRDMDLELSGIRMETDALLTDGASAFIATVKAKRRVAHTGILAELSKLEGVDYIEEI